jgi:hypothetical protein
VMAKRDGPLAFGRPDPAQDRLQANAVLVGRPDLDRLVRVLGPLLGDSLFQLFLNASRSSGVAEAGWRGRGLLHRPADRLQGLPAALRQDGSEPEFTRHPARYLRAGPQATIRRRLKQTSLELLQQVRPQDRGAGAVPAPQITQSLGTVGVIASPQTLTWGRSCQSSVMGSWSAP